jgi:hypothetical protein
MNLSTTPGKVNIAFWPPTFFFWNIQRRNVWKLHEWCIALLYTCWKLALVKLMHLLFVSSELQWYLYDGPWLFNNIMSTWCGGDLSVVVRCFFPHPFVCTLSHHHWQLPPHQALVNNMPFFIAQSVWAMFFYERVLGKLFFTKCVIVIIHTGTQDDTNKESLLNMSMLNIKFNIQIKLATWITCVDHYLQYIGPYCIGSKSDLFATFSLVLSGHHKLPQVGAKCWCINTEIK